MKKTPLSMNFRSIILAFAILFSSSIAFAQIVTITPSSATGDDEVTLVFDATQGNAGLVGEDKVYIHAGIVTDAPDGSEWQYVIGNWGKDDGVGEMTKVTGEENKWEFTYTPTVREYHSAPSSENIFRLSMVFRNADGSKKGEGTPGNINGGTVASNGDIYMDLVVESYISITSPSQNELVLDVNEAIPIAAEASATASTLALSVDEGSGFQEIETASQTTK